MTYRKFCFILFLVGCASKEPPAYLDVPINETYADSLLKAHGDKNLAILSTRTCDCFRTNYNKAFQEYDKVPTAYLLMTDTAINKFNFPVLHIPRTELFKISPDLYNLVLFKRTASGIHHRIVRVSESDNIEKVAQKFFAEEQ